MHALHASQCLTNALTRMAGRLAPSLCSAREYEDLTAAGAAGSSGDSRGGTCVPLPPGSTAALLEAVREDYLERQYFVTGAWGFV